MRIAIVGGTGTVGRHIAAELTARGHEARVLSRSGQYPVDLTTGAGLTAALAGCDVVVDASNAQKRAREVLVEGSRRLLAAEAEAGVGHHVCISIVGCDQVPAGYYKVKTEQERVVQEAAVPWTIVQATQFHELAATFIAAAAKYRILPVPRMKIQTIAAAEAGRAVADVAVAPPAHRRIRVAGPQILTGAELARTWRRVTGKTALQIPVPVPGRLGRTLRDGGLTAGEPDVRGIILFADWLAERGAI